MIRSPLPGLPRSMAAGAFLALASIGSVLPASAFEESSAAQGHPAPPAASARPAAPSRASSDVVAAAVGRWAALATPDGRIILSDARETRREWKAPGRPVTALAIDPDAALREAFAAAPGPRPAPRVVLASPADSAGVTEVFALDGDSGEVLGRARVTGEAAFVVASPGVRAAWVVAREAATAPPGRPAREVRWTLAGVDLSGAGGGGTISLEGPVLDAAGAPDGERIYLAMEDRIRSFRTGPLRSSWMLRAPGRNDAIAPVGSGSEVLVARGGRLLRYDADHLPGRDPTTGTFRPDDAGGAIPLPFPASVIVTRPGGSVAAVLDPERRRLAIVDLERGRVVETRDVGPSAAVLLPHDRDVVLTVDAEGNGLEIAYSRPEPEAPAEAPGAASGAGPRPTPAAPAPGAPHETGAGSAAGSAPEPGRATPPGSVAPGAERTQGDAGTGPAREPAAGPARPEPIAPPSAPSEPEAPPLAATEPPGAQAPSPGARPADEPAVPGRIGGRIGGARGLVRSVVIYGPNSLLKVHARITPAEDGSWSHPLPPPGSYRILLEGAGGASLAYEPPYWQIVVAAEGIGGITFSVAGKVPGGLKP